MKTRLGLYAIPFGFGPVSKAVAIAKAISKEMDVHWVLLGQGISLEFMKREGMDAEIVQMPSSINQESVLTSVRDKIDGAVVLMDNEWAAKLAPHIPVFFADSLGFMWSKNDFEQFPGMQKIQKYYVQDLFGAYSHMSSLGLGKLAPVPPIIDTEVDAEFNDPGRVIVHMGGLLNPMNPKTTEVYLKGAEKILKRLQLEDPLLLMSEAARFAFPGTVSGMDAQSLSHPKAMSVISTAAHVFSSPGLTTLLEMAKFSVACSPMPPQNYSQVLNIHNMVSTYGKDLHDVWHMLDKAYEKVYAGMPEEEGVRAVTELNAERLTNERFLGAFAELSADAKKKAGKLPQGLVAKRSGAQIIAEDVRNHFQTARLG